MKIRTTALKFVSSLLSSILLLTGLAIPGQAQNRVIIINADQPNVWTLEQAHYLLAQMHRRNLDLKAKSLDDLDPNEIAGLRFDLMRMLVEFGASFNQADLASNRMFSRNQEFNTTRRDELTAERDRLRKESITLAAELDDLEGKKADAESDEEKARLDAKIASKKTRLAKVDKEIENINGELETLNVSSGERKATAAGAQFDPEKLPKSVFDDAFKEAAAAQIEKFNQAPKLNASLRLDNFLQMQYEIIAKQLTLLRDEVGPGERLLFLEMPQSVAVAHHEADKKWAQSWWKIRGYSKRMPKPVGGAAPAPTGKVSENQQPITTTDDVNSIIRGEPIKVSVTSPPAPCSTTSIVSNGGGIMINSLAAGAVGAVEANPYPSFIDVTGVSGKVKKISVTLGNLSHTRPDDIDVLLVAPNGQSVVLLSDAGGATPLANQTLTFDDDAAYPILDAGPIAPGSFKPSLFGEPLDKFTLPAPTGPRESTLATFNGINPNGRWNLYVMDDHGGHSGTIAGGWSMNITVDCTAAPTVAEVDYENKFFDLDVPPAIPAAPAILTDWQNYFRKVDLSDRTVRTVELIPRQSSLNVNDMKLQTRSGAFNFALSTLFGFGSQLNVQRQREQFAQFVQQELYSSAFGKGSREFGWTFTPMPGMDRLQSGVRTTYAVVVVPDNATSLLLETNGCYFPRSAYPPSDFEQTKLGDWNSERRTSRNCSAIKDGVNFKTKAFVVPIPAATLDGSNDFWVDRISYQPVGKGERIVVLISGKNFSSQIGVLINGVPLIHSIGMAQPLIRDDSIAGGLTEREFRDVDIPGRIERVDANKIVFSFKMPKDFEGIPTITLVAPGKAIDINWLDNIGINGEAPATLSSSSKKACNEAAPTPSCVHEARPMFLGDPVRPLRIDSVEAFRRPGRKMNVLISGAGFKENDTVFINGTPLIQPGRFVSATLLRAEDIEAPSDDKIQITLNNGEKTIKSTAIVNPMQLRIEKVTVISYEPAKDKKRGVLVVRIEGSGFSRDLLRSPRKIQLAVTSSTEAFLTIPSPNETEVVTLTDPATRLSVSTVVARKPPE